MSSVFPRKEQKGLIWMNHVRTRYGCEAFCILLCENTSKFTLQHVQVVVLGLSIHIINFSSRLLYGVLIICPNRQ